MARVAVVGVGAIGGALAALLETAGGHEITLCTRRPLPALTVKTPQGVVNVKARNVVDPAQAMPVDWVLVATKAYDAEATAASSLPCARMERRWPSSCRTAWNIGERFARLYFPGTAAARGDRLPCGTNARRLGVGARRSVDEG